MSRQEEQSIVKSKPVTIYHNGSPVSSDNPLPTSSGGVDSTTITTHFAIAFDPKAICDGAVDRLFLRTIGEDAPDGYIITAWRCSFEADPTTEVDLDLKRADAFIGVANSAVVDVVDTTAGVSSETTPDNINGGVAIANGKVLYLEFGTAYTETNHQIIFEMWGHAV